MRRSLPVVLLSLCSLAIGAGVGVAHAATATTAAAAQAASAAEASSQSARVIVKFKPGSSLISTVIAPTSAAPERAKALGRRMGMNFRAGIALSERSQVVTASGMTSRQLAQRLAAESDVEYAVEDQRRYRLAVPNDPLYGPNQTAPALTVGQWYLRPPSSDIPAAINAEGAWDITTGSPSVVVAVLDSGVRYDHADLAGNLLPGYDMIADVPTGNDGDGRDADASDPGDWVTSQEAFRSGGDFAGCEVESSSWHGTQISGIVAALTNNGLGMASVGRTVKVLPVRVLGKCGGRDSDIQAAMRWAVGLPVPGVPMNPNPDKILNLSLGSSGSCGSAYVDAINAVNATGALIVSSAGNSAGHSVSTPANCPGIIAVGGLRHVGTKVGFSDVGTEIALSAPAGNCVTSSGTCQYPILTTSDAGTTTPSVNSSIYTDGGADASLGTSFSAPLVAATAALVWSAQPQLTRDEVRQILLTSARPFPTSGAGTSDNNTAVPMCHAPGSDDQLECYCTTDTCGAGMLDAAGATSLATTGLFGRITSTPTPAVAAEPVQLSASTSVVATGRTIASYAWSIADGGGIVSAFTGPTNAASATVTPTVNGRFTVSLTIVDSTGVSSTVSGAIAVGPLATSTSTTPPTPTTPAPAAGGGGGGSIDYSWLLLMATAVGAMRWANRRR
jgi:serine protease